MKMPFFKQIESHLFGHGDQSIIIFSFVLGVTEPCQCFNGNNLEGRIIWEKVKLLCVKVDLFLIKNVASWIQWNMVIKVNAVTKSRVYNAWISLQW